MDPAAPDPSLLKAPETAGLRPAAEAWPTAQALILGNAQAASRRLPLAEPRPAVCRPRHPYAERADTDPDIRILALAYPEFTISEPGPGRNGPAWTVIRKDPAQPGLYPVTPDLAELRDILACHASQEADRSDLET